MLKEIQCFSYVSPVATSKSRQFAQFLDLYDSMRADSAVKRPFACAEYLETELSRQSILRVLLLARVNVRSTLTVGRALCIDSGLSLNVWFHRKPSFRPRKMGVTGRLLSANSSRSISKLDVV